MSLASGARLGPYEILAPLGAGGMGEVYRATDTRLKREVAIKILPTDVADDLDRLRRFEQEARAAAALNHPNILSVYDVGHQDAVAYLVTELLDGRTLRELLSAETVAVPRVIDFAAQIADGLAAAHARGIIHRDIKPENLFVTNDGRVKILDFGLAKATEAGPQAVTDASTRATTAPHTVLGTLGYMAPEQVRGGTVDSRADIFAFGCVLYEMLSGRRAFTGTTSLDTMSAILKDAPEPIETATNRAIPPALVRIVDRCLEKPPAARFQTATDLAFALRTLTTSANTSAVDTGAATRRTAAPWWHRAWPLGGLLIGAVLATGWWWLVQPRTDGMESPTIAKRFAIPLSPNSPLQAGRTPALAVAPDGSRLVYVASSGNGTQLLVRAMDQFAPVPLLGTEGATNPFFSPDGQWVGFFAGGKLKKIPVVGGTPLTLCDAPLGFGASWGADSTIVFSPKARSGLQLVSSAGGMPKILTTPQADEYGASHRWPEFLPDGQTILFTIVGAQLDYSSIAVQSPGGGAPRILVKNGGLPHYVAASASAGYLIYARTSGLMAAPFDLKRLQVTGPAVAVLEDLFIGSQVAHFGFSRDGTLVYLPGRSQRANRDLWRADRKGVFERLSATAHPYYDPRVSPDGRRIALGIQGEPNHDIWVFDIDRQTLTRITFAGDNVGPVWTPDGKRLVYSSNRDSGQLNLYWRPADGSGPKERLTVSGHRQYAGSVSPSGQQVAFDELHDARTDIWMLPLNGDRKPNPFIQTAANNYQAMFSPDGHWLAYTSDESGRPEVYVQASQAPALGAPSGPGGKWQVSTDGGTQPVWARNGQEVFYRSGSKLLAVALTTAPRFALEKPRVLLEEPAAEGRASYDVLPDGQHFVMVKEEEQPAPTQLNIVLGWLDELARRVK